MGFSRVATRLEIFLRLARMARFFPYFDGFNANNIPSKCQKRIGAYDRPEGCTYRVMRFECNLPTTAPRIAVVPWEFGPAAEEKYHLKKLRDANALQASSGNIDPSGTTMAHIWKSISLRQSQKFPRNERGYARSTLIV